VTTDPTAGGPVAARALADRLLAACGALYVVLLVVGDDFVNPAGEVPGADASPSSVASYLDRADTDRFWLGRSIGLFGLCALLVFVASMASRIRASETARATLPNVAMAAGCVAVTLQFLAAPPVFAAVRAGDELEPEVAHALIQLNASFSLSFLPLGVFLACVALASRRGRLMPRWLGAAAGLIAVLMISGMVGHPQYPAVVSYVGFALSLPWFVAASVALMQREPVSTATPA
jgi:hypothetical protein